jgi:hypothetical protein
VRHFLGGNQMLIFAVAARRAALCSLLLAATVSVADAQDCGIVGCGDPVCGFADECGDSCGSCCLGNCKGNGYDQFWVRGEYLYWQVTGTAAPPLVTSSPQGTSSATAGRLDQSTTSVLVGGDELTDKWQSGFGVSGGYWLDSRCGVAVVGDYFHIGDNGFNSSLGPADNVIYARPFFNSELGGQDAELVNVPEELAGNVHVQSTSRFQGAGLGLEKCMWSCGDPNSCGRSGWLTVIGGYRYYQLNSSLQINEDLMVLDDTPTPLVPGTSILVEDKFGASNQFHGGEIGLQGRRQEGFLWIDGLAAIAVGGNMRKVSINGGTDVTVPGAGSASSAGGLLTSSETNIGNYSDTQATVIPRFRIGVGCQISERVSARFGYNAIIWTDAVQAASQLPPDLATDPRNLPPVQGGGGPQPANPGMFGTTVVAHGADLGLELTF